MVSCVGLWFLYVWFCVYCAGLCGSVHAFVGFCGIWRFYMYFVFMYWGWGCYERLGRFLSFFFIWVGFFGRLLIFSGWFGCFLVALGFFFYFREAGVFLGVGEF